MEEASFASEDYDDDIFVDGEGTLIKRGRVSTTTRQLDAKARRDAADEPRKKIEKMIWKQHYCQDINCDKNPGCHYVLQSRGSHHDVTPLDLKQWATMIQMEHPDVTIERPPIEWIRKYHLGWQEIPRKKLYGNKKQLTIEPAIVPKAETAPVVVHNYPAPAHSYPMAPPIPYYGYTGIPGLQNDPYRTQNPPLIQQLNASALTVSSPLRPRSSGADPLPQFKTYILDKVTSLQRSELIQEAFAFLELEFIEFAQLKDRQTFQTLREHGVKSGIIQHLQKEASKFQKAVDATKGTVEEICKGPIGPRGGFLFNGIEYNSRGGTGGGFGARESQDQDQDGDDYFSES